MSKKIQLELSETEYRKLLLCYSLGELVKDHTEEKTQEEMMEVLKLDQILSKAAYEAKLKGSGYQEGIYYYGKDLEEEMLEILEEFKEYVASGEDEEDTEEIRKYLEKMGVIGKKK